MAAASFKAMSKIALKKYLMEKGVLDHIAENFFKNEVTGDTFLKLNEEEIKELCPLIGVRPLIRDIIRTCIQKLGLYSSHYCYRLLMWTVVMWMTADRRLMTRMYRLPIVMTLVQMWFRMTCEITWGNNKAM